MVSASSVSLAAALAWPVTALTLVLIFRPTISQLLIGIERISFKGLDLYRRLGVDSKLIELEAQAPGARVSLALQQELIDQGARKLSKVSLADLKTTLIFLSKEFEATRASMPSSDERTTSLEKIANRMRILAGHAERLLPELAASSAMGKRLAAIVALQVGPNSAFYSWLAERVDREGGFLGYHAAVALRSAARTANQADKTHLERLLRHTLERLEESVPEGGTDRKSTLRQALDDLGKSASGPRTAPKSRTESPDARKVA